MNPRATVVIPTCNRAHFLPDVIAALQAQDEPAFRVVIVDDGSTDGTADVARAAIAGDPRFDVVSIENKGPAAARNIACATAETPWLAFTDDDCIPQPSWLSALLATAATAGADLVQGRTVSDPAVRRAELPWFARGKDVDRHSLNRYQTCNLLIRTARLQEVGGFDESFPPHGFGEDTDVGLRIRRAGGTYEFADEAVVHHRVITMSYAEFLRRRYRWAQVVRLVAVNPDARATFPHRYVAQRTHVALWAGVPLTAWSLKRGWWPVPAAAVGSYVLQRAVATRREGRPLMVRVARAPLELVGVAVEAVGFAVESVRQRTPLI